MHTSDMNKKRVTIEAENQMTKYIKKRKEEKHRHRIGSATTKRRKLHAKVSGMDAGSAIELSVVKFNWINTRINIHSVLSHYNPF